MGLCPAVAASGVHCFWSSLYCFAHEKLRLSFIHCCAVTARVVLAVKRKDCRSDVVVARRTMSNHVIKMAAVAAEDRPNTVRIRVIVPDVKYQVRLHNLILQWA